jgi:site-specific recombinase XerD
MRDVNDRLGLWPRHVENLQLRGRSPCTIYQRQRVLTALSAAVDLADVGYRDVNAFLLTFSDQKTRSVYRSHIVTFYKWAFTEELLEQDWTERVPKIATHRGVPRPIPEADFARALAASRGRLRLWLILGYDAGLRCKEIAGLRREDVFARSMIVMGKGSQERTVALTERLVAELNTYGTEGHGWMFPGRTGDAVLASSVSLLINRHLHDLGIASTAHKLRHGFATRVYQKTHDIRLVQELLGHASIATTQAYAQADMTKAAAAMAMLDGDAA